MEKEFYHNDFEDLIKEKADQYKMYPSDKVWKGIDRSLRSRRKWYWSGFVILLSGISYVAITEILSPASLQTIAISSLPAKPAAEQISTTKIIPFSSTIVEPALRDENDKNASVSDPANADSGTLTASFDIPFRLFNADGTDENSSFSRGSLRIEGLAPLQKNEQYNIELSLPVFTTYLSPSDIKSLPEELTASLAAGNLTGADELNRINWLQEEAAFKMPSGLARHISWQLAFSPTVNYRKLTGGDNGKVNTLSRDIPLSLLLEGDVNKVVNHKPALGFELGTYGIIPLTKNLTLRGGIQFNYSKYDIRAFHSPNELATIALNSSTGLGPADNLTSYTDIRNFGGTSVENLKNQYYQLSVPVGLELKLLGNDRIQFNIAGSLQPTYLINRNTYLITTDYKNYTTAPSLVRRWNLNMGAEAFVSYNRGDVKWQVGPQFRYQLLSSYDKAYPIKEYLMEYGIKIGITKTIR